MAIQLRRGVYNDFDERKLVAGEGAVVLSGDPNVSDGRALYISFETGHAKRMATFEDMKVIEDALNAQEAIRQENERVRNIAENGRRLSENVRVQNEHLRDVIFAEFENKLNSVIEDMLSLANTIVCDAKYFYLVGTLFDNATDTYDESTSTLIMTQYASYEDNTLVISAVQ